MGVLRPLKVVIENYPEGKTEWLDAVNNPEDPKAGTRKVPFSRELYIERDDFREEAPRKFFRLMPGREVRLRYAYFITCTDVIKDAKTGEIIELRCIYDPETRGGDAPDKRKVRGTLHWVSCSHALSAEVRLYDRLFTVENPLAEEGDYLDSLNPESLTVLKDCRLEPSLENPDSPVGYQLERQGYFKPDSVYSVPGKLVFNQTVSLKDTWAKIENAQKKQAGKKKQMNTDNDKSAPAESAAAPLKEEISFDEFSRIDLRVGIVKEAGLVEGAKKLIRLLVDIGEEQPRQIFAGIRASYPEPDVLIGKPVAVVANLAPRKMSFGTSEAMVLSGGQSGSLSVVTFDGQVQPGDSIS